MRTIKNEKEILTMLDKLLGKQKIYKNQKLSLINLSKELNTNTSYLSTIINTHYHCNFKTLINQLRIDEACIIMMKNKHQSLSIKGIAEEVGFKSRSRFYLAFKKYTGLSPLQYISNRSK